MSDWFEVRLPMQFAWYSEPNFWLSALIGVYHNDGEGKFVSRVGLGAYRVRHTLLGISLDMVAVLIDPNRNRVLLAAFPAHLGPTVGSSLVPGVPGDQARRDEVAGIELSLARGAGLDRVSLVGPDGANWKVFTSEPDLDSDLLFQSGGRTLSSAGARVVEEFVTSVLTAAGEWTVLKQELRERISNLEVEVTPHSAAESA